MKINKDDGDFLRQVILTNVYANFPETEEDFSAGHVHLLTR